MGTHDVTETPRHSVSVAAAIFDESGENVLLIKRRDNGHWEPPGGVLELDETIEEGLRREILEETGASIRIDRLTGIYKNMAQGIVALVFRCEVTSPAVTQTSEAAEIRWKSLDSTSSLMNQAYQVRLLDATRDGPPALRSHDGTNLLADSAHGG